MSDADDRTAALALLDLWLQPDVVPPLTDPDIEAVLDQNKAATYWQPNTAYSVGQRIIPLTRNGYWYQVIQPGTSQAGNRAFSEWPTPYGSRLVDGSSDPQLILENAGEDSIFRADYTDPLSVNVYDVRGTARQCVQLAMKRASQIVDSDQSGVGSIFDRLKELLNQFHPIRWPIRVVRG